MAMIYFLDGNQEVIKIARSSAVISAIQTQELPENNSLMIDRLSVQLKNDERLFDAQYMAIKSYKGNRNSFDMYRIVTEVVPDATTEFEGVQVAPYELEGVVVEDLRPKNRTVEYVAEQILADSDWRVGYVDDNLPTVTTNFYYLSAKDSLKKLQELTGVEFTFKVEISGNKITDKWVEIYRELGNRTLKRFNYGTNALTVKRETNHSELYTALIGRGKGEETESGGHGRRITFKDVVWSKSNGNPVDKPAGQKYIELPEATSLYGIKQLDGTKKPRIGLVEFAKTEDPDVLIKETWEALQYYARPKVLFTATVANIGDTGIGDTVTVHRHELNMHYKTRVRKVVRDRKNNDYTQVDIGDVVHTPSTKRQSTVSSKLDNLESNLSDVQAEVSYVVKSADGKNDITYGNVEPERKRVGDSWVRDHTSLAGETQWLVWDGEAWELIMDTSETTKNAEDVLEAKGIAETARDNALNIATDLLEGTSFYKHTQDIGLASKNSDGTVNSIINLGNDGTAYVGGENIVLDGNTIVDGTFTITDKMIAPNAEIDGAKIQNATIGSAKIASLDVGKISGNTTNFVQSNWNSAAGGNVRITGSGILTTASDNSQTYVQNGIVGTRNPNGATIGQIGYINDGGSPTYTITTSLGSHFKIKQNRSGTLRDSLFLNAGGYDGGIGTNRFEFTGNQGVHFYNQLTLQNDLNGNEYNIYGAYDLQLFHGGYLRTISDGQTRLSSSGGMLQLGVSGSWKLTMDSTYLYAQVNLSMGGNDITNQSDERLKTNILDHRESSLDKISRFNFVDFEWVKNGREDFGVIAQQVQKVAPDLILEGADGYLSVNNSLLNMMTTHAVQQLAHKHDAVEETVNSHTDTIHTLQQELSQANRKIKELEEQIA